MALQVSADNLNSEVCLAMANGLSSKREWLVRVQWDCSAPDPAQPAVAVAPQRHIVGFDRASYRALLGQVWSRATSCPATLTPVARVMHLYMCAEARLSEARNGHPCQGQYTATVPDSAQSTM